MHIDHASTVEGHWLLIAIHAKTTWHEVIAVPNTTSVSTITALCNLFACFGLPQSLSDNGTGFCSAEFTYFLQKNDIMHIRMAPYHPNSISSGERAVRAGKSALKKVKEGTFMEILDIGFFSTSETTRQGKQTGISSSCNLSVPPSHAVGLHSKYWKPNT